VGGGVGGAMAQYGRVSVCDLDSTLPRLVTRRKDVVPLGEAHTH